MADENKNTGTRNSSFDDASKLKQNLKDILEDQGDYNNLLKDSIKHIGGLDAAYTKVAARINSLNRSTINTKQLNQELQKLSQKRYVTDKNLSDLEKKISEDSKSLVEFAQKEAKSKEDALAFLKSSGDLEAIALYTAREATKIAENQYNIGKAELENEKKVSKQIGISGNLAKAFAEKLGVGEEAYEAMTISARNLVDEQEGNIKQLSKWKVAAVGLKSIFSSLFENFLDPAVFLPVIGGAISSLTKGFMKLVELALSAQDRTVKFGRNLGMSYDNALKVRNEFTKIAFQSDSILINSEKLMQSQEELTGILGTNNILSAQILSTNIKLKDLAGLEADTRGEIVQSSIITGKSMESTTKSVLAQVVGLQKATGISFNFQKILKEASTLGGYLGLSFAKYPDKLTKSLVTVKAMGLELKQLDSMADSFLDFESSITNEFEAQLLTGKNINLSRARELFLNNQLAEAAQEITSQVGSADEFLKMNRISAESLAKSFGMSRDQLGEMLKRQELLSRIGAKDTDNAQKQLEIGLKRFGNQKALAAAVGEEAYNSMVNASSQEKIAAFMDKIKQSIADFVANSPLIPMIERAIDWLSKPSNIQKIMSYVQSGFAFIFDIVGKTAGVIMKIGNFFGAGIDQSLIDTAFSGGDSIRALNLTGPVATVGATMAQSQAKSSTYSSSNQMGAGIQRDRQSDTYISVQMDRDTGTATVNRVARDPGSTADYSRIANPQ